MAVLVLFPALKSHFFSLQSLTLGVAIRSCLTSTSNDALHVSLLSFKIHTALFYLQTKRSPLCTYSGWRMTIPARSEHGCQPRPRIASLLFWSSPPLSICPALSTPTMVTATKPTMATETENDRPTDWLTGRLGRHRAKRAHGGSPPPRSLTPPQVLCVACQRACVRPQRPRGHIGTSLSVARPNRKTCCCPPPPSPPSSGAQSCVD